MVDQLALKSTRAGLVTIEFLPEPLTLMDKVAKARKTNRTMLIKKLVLDGLAELASPVETAKKSSETMEKPRVIPDREVSVTQLWEAVRQARFILNGDGDIKDPEIRKLAIDQEVMEHGLYEQDKGWSYRGKFLPISHSPPKRHRCYLDDLKSEFE
jgi:hypothetical protein